MYKVHKRIPNSFGWLISYSLASSANRLQGSFIDPIHTESQFLNYGVSPAGSAHVGMEKTESNMVRVPAFRVCLTVSLGQVNVMRGKCDGALMAHMEVCAGSTIPDT